ncbi:ATP-binding protein [Schlegelella sp. S2-27]|uniref:histidine kinase n=1 Tax=Caldimonas mangrovi TaxID=2944811 RepID=A0ABT0YSB0_9BURK|nr:ATP-binding protein [Caldimonas mangrovi]MCM5681611.1 ATP-binding protein [Caldimonas mangrovi]
MTTDLSIASFDAEIDFADLFGDAELADWQDWLSALHRAPVRLLPPQQAEAGDWVIEHELESLLAVRAALEPLADPVRAVFSRYVRERIRYRLASRLHITATQADYERVLASEARYRGLAAQLEERVQQQVAELQRAQLYAFQAEQLRSVAQLAAGMAHEINNPVGFLSSNLRTARDYLGELRPLTAPSGTELIDDFGALLDEALEGARRIATIVAHLRQFSNVDRSSVCEADVAALAKAVIALIRTEIPGTVTLHYCGPELLYWVCEPARISQALHQLMRNASQAVGDNGRIELHCTLDGNELSLRVCDNGCGMSEETRARACDPFFSTRDVGQGVGLGLSLAAETARLHGGRLLLRPGPDAGTEVELRLPAAGVEAAGVPT